jgi:hypothetical protein
MKTKKVFLSFFITAIVMIIIFILLEVYYAAGAIAIGMLVVGHREIWSLITKGKLPPIDERVKENINKSIRNSFIFFGMISILTILFYITDQYEPIQPDLKYFLSGLLLSIGIVYVLSYIFYDRVEASLDGRGLKIFRAFLIVATISLLIFVIDSFFINTINTFINFTFHRILLYVSSFVFALGIIGSTIIFIKGLFTRSNKNISIATKL